MEGLGVAASAIAVVELSAKVASLCFQYSKDVKNAKDDIERLCGEVINLENAATSVYQLLSGPNSAKLKASQQLFIAIRDSQSQLQRLHENLRPKTARQAISRLGLRALKWPFQSKDAEKIIQDLGRCTQTMILALQVDQTTILLEMAQKTVLDRLPIAIGASFDSHAEEHNSTCLPNTRVELLRQISAWADDPGAEAVFWLNGMAGTGKSTISRTIAQSFAGKGHLGASFFFKRGEADRGSLSKFFTTIAADLVVREPAIARHVKDAIDTEPTILRKSMREQFDKLILQPLSNISPNAGNDDPIIIIVDALDECEREDDIKLMIRLFSRAKSLQSVRLKIFLTSRPELPIRLGFKAIEGKYQDLILHEIPEPVVEHDISAFLEYELAKIRGEYNASVPEDRQLATNWPGQSNIKSLVKMAIPLFIFAATVCRFLADRKCGNPEGQLKDVLLLRTRSQESQLDATYLPVLNNLIIGLSAKQQDKVLEQFRDVVGSIVILASPLSTSALAQILNIPGHTIDDRLDMLHSVLSIPTSAESPVRLLHLSFRDFLVDSEKRKENPFWIDEKQAHKAMAVNCLRVMNCLKQDLCGIEAPGTLRSTIDPQKIDASLPPEVRYACLYWVYHMQEAGIHVADGEQVHGFLIYHFLHWMEALSLIGRASESLNFIKTLQSVLKPQCSKQLSDFLDDAMRFILANISAIDSTPLQIYSSLLTFAPERSKVRATFKGEIPRWICVEPKVESDWGQCLQTLEGHSNAVCSVAFSHDSALVASASDDKTVWIWRADTGECMQTLEGHSDAVWSVAFSHDSALVASASHDKTVRIWRADTGECMQTLEGHSDSVSSVAFSHDSALVASASHDKTVRIWRADTGECMQTLEGHSDWVSSVAFSHDSALVASASDDKTVQIWRADTGECIQDIDIGVVPRLLFEPGNSRLLTDVGAITIDGMAPTCPAIDSLTSAIPAYHSGYGISRDRCWVTWNENALLWLPVEFRPSCSAISGSTVIIGCSSGRVMVIGLSHKVPELLQSVEV